MAPEIGNLILVRDKVTTEILTKLLSRGYLPIQLPPGFTSETFASKLSDFQEKWDKVPDKEIPLTQPERFSVPRSSYYRRNTAIVNPIGFYFLAREIAAHWPKIEAHYKQSSLSRSKPSFEGSLRAIQLRKFSELYEEKVISAAGYQYALVTDITGFFPTIYTHTIPWAAHGKSIAKRNRSRKKNGLFGNLLDGKCMLLQDGQTIGLPIGPDTSHILAELIGVSIDLRLKKELGGWPAGFRYVDDFFLFFNSRNDAERGLAAVVKAVSSFELQINPAKTRIIEVKDLVEESWKYAVKRLKIAASRKRQRDDIHHYFEVLFSLEKKFKDESLIKYGLKQISSTIIKKSNWQIFEAYLLKCGYGFPNTIQVIAQILSTYNHHGYALNLEAIKRFCNNLITSAAATDHHGEVAWLLWICKELRIELETKAATEVERMASPVCSLILLDLHNNGLVKQTPKTGLLTTYAQENALIGPDWLFSYEAGRRNWLGLNETAYIDDHKFFGPLKAAGVVFYDTSKRCTPIFDFKHKPAPDEEFDFDFDTDDEIEDEFEFDKFDEEYFDSTFGDDDEINDLDDETEDNNDNEDAEFNENKIFFDDI